MARTPFLMLIISVSFNLRADVELFNDLDSKPSKKTMEIDLFSDEKPQKREINSVKTDRKATKKVHKRAKKASFGNLPKHQIPKKKFKKYSGASTIFPEAPTKEYLEDIKIGQYLMIKFDQKLIGFPGSKVPARAMIEVGEYKGSILYGHASMSQTTKRLLLNFNILTLPNGLQYQLDADLLSPDGTLGLVGEIHSNKAELFGLDLIFSAFKGYSEATKDRNTTALGQEYAQANQRNAKKNAVSEASQASINRIRNEFLNVDEFVSTNEVSSAIVILNKRPFKM